MKFDIFISSPLRDPCVFQVLHLILFGFVFLWPATCIIPRPCHLQRSQWAKGMPSSQIDEWMTSVIDYSFLFPAHDPSFLFILYLTTLKISCRIIPNSAFDYVWI